MNYRDFEIRIEPKRGDYYPVNVLDSPAGQGRGEFRLPFSPEERGDLLTKLGRSVRSTSHTNTRLTVTDIAAEQNSPSNVGSQLFRALFSGNVRTLFDRSLGRIEGRRGQGLRIKIHLDPEHPDLAGIASLPWEFMYQSQTRDFLNLSRMTPIVRFLDVPRPSEPLTIRLPLRILAVVSSPEGEEKLDLERERENIEKAWGRNDSVEVVFLEESTIDALRHALLEQPCHVLHFMGHGGFIKSAGQGVLLMEDHNGKADAISGQALATMLRDANDLRLVFLNACDTARTTSSEGLDPFSGVATALVMGGVPAVVAMQFPITDRAAIAFSEKFYPRLAAGDPVDAAVAEGRMGIYLDDSDSLEWGTPVLFMRTPNGLLFETAGQDTTKSKTARRPRRPIVPEIDQTRRDSEEQNRQAARLNLLYQQAQASFFTGKLDRAIELYSQVVSESENYKDAVAKLESATHQRTVAHLFEEADEAFQSRQWDDAITGLAELIILDSDHVDANRLLEDARQSKALDKLYSEAQQLARVEHWRAVISILDRIAEQSPEYSDTEGLREAANSAIDAERRRLALESGYDTALANMDSGKWVGALKILKQISKEQSDYKETADLLERARLEVDRIRAEKLAKEKLAAEELAKKERLAAERATRRRGSESTKKDVVLSRIKSLLSGYSHERLYLHPHIPPEKLQNACKKTARGVRADDILLLYDDTFLQSGKDGIVLTSTGVYWKDMWSSPMQESYSTMPHVRPEGRKVHIGSVETSVAWGGVEAIARVLEGLRKDSQTLDDKNLTLVHGIGAATAQLLRDQCGIMTLSELAGSSPELIAKRISRASEETASQWVHEAIDLVGNEET